MSVDEPASRIADLFMANKGYADARRVAVSRVPGADTWKFSYRLPEGNLELAVSWIEAAGWDAHVCAFEPLEDVHKADLRFFDRDADGSMRIRFRLTPQEASVVEEAAGSKPPVEWLRETMISASQKTIEALHSQWPRTRR